MNRDLSIICINKLIGLPYVQVLSGIVKTVTNPTVTDEGTFPKRYPVSEDTNIPADCRITKEYALIPDSSKASIIYFEDGGVSNTISRGRFQRYQSNLRLVCWMNKNKLFADGSVNSNAAIIAGIMRRLTNLKPENAGMFQRLTIRQSRIPVLDAGIFSKYTYSEELRQYLRPPFDFFAIDLTCTYEIKAGCTV